VQVHAFIDDDAQAEAQRVIGIVRDAQQAQPQQRIAVLVRNRGHLLAIAAALRAAGIAYRAVDLESLAERPAITDLRALTWALLHPLDRVAWLALLRAPWCGLRLADLHTLAADLPPQHSLLAALRDEARRARLSADGRVRLQRTLGTLEAALAQQGRLPLRRWVEATWTALGGPACAQGDTALQDAAVFFDCLQRVAPGAVLEDFAALDLALRELKASADPAAGDALSVMTIHKSKGLEFDTVIVPGLGRGTRSDDPPPVAWIHRDAGNDTRLLLAPVHATGDARSASYDYVRALEAERQRQEDARLLYVAATRARERLHLLGGVRRDAQGAAAHPPERSLLARLWPVVSTAFADAAAQAPPAHAAADIAADRPPPPLRRLRAWQAPPLPEGLPLPSQPAPQSDALRFDWAGEIARSVGLAFHRFVQHIAEDGVAQWDVARCVELRAAIGEELRALGVPQAHREAAAQRVLQALENTLADARGRWLLEPHAQAASELALATLRDGRYQRRIIDRSFVDAQGQRWIVDFKTGAHEGGDVAGFVLNELARYRGQLQEYCGLMRQLDPAHPVRAALYLPLVADAALRWVELEG
jgi:ATP-dependent helicase/nuclease subunit A